MVLNLWEWSFIVSFNSLLPTLLYKIAIIFNIFNRSKWPVCTLLSTISSWTFMNKLSPALSHAREIGLPPPTWNNHDDKYNTIQNKATQHSNGWIYSHQPRATPPINQQDPNRCHNQHITFHCPLPATSEVHLTHEPIQVYETIHRIDLNLPSPPWPIPSEMEPLMQSQGINLPTSLDPWKRPSHHPQPPKQAIERWSHCRCHWINLYKTICMCLFLRCLNIQWPYFHGIYYRHCYFLRSYADELNSSRGESSTLHIFAVDGPLLNQKQQVSLLRMNVLISLDQACLPWVSITSAHKPPTQPFLSLGSTLNNLHRN